MNDNANPLEYYLFQAVIAAILRAGCSFPGFNESAQIISMNDLPQAVKMPEEKETAGYRIIEVEKGMKNGYLIYAITYDRDGTEKEVEYSPDGKLISKGKE